MYGAELKELLVGIEPKLIIQSGCSAHCSILQYTTFPTTSDYTENKLLAEYNVVKMPQLK